MSKGKTRQQQEDDDPCECGGKVTLNPKKPIKLTESDGASATFEPNFQKNAPGCSEGCGKPDLHFKWTLEKITAGPVKIVGKDDQEEVKVQGPGTFTICLEVSWECKKRIDSTHVFTITPCAGDKGCRRFQIEVV
jgi:hypothetical protein